MKIQYLLSLISIFSTVRTGYRTSLPMEEQLMLVEVHNYKRSMVKPPASNMLQMIFSQDLADSAQDWANLCTFDYGRVHTDRRKFKEVGQNIAFNMNEPFLKRSVDSWDFEKWSYDYWNVSCRSGMCKHYTQVVWDDTYLVGCGAKHCPNADQELYWNYLVCHYYGAGNRIRRKPYKNGTSCSACPSKAPKCMSNLCVNSSVVGGLTMEEQLRLVYAHNYRRGRVQPPASNMLKMRFSQDLADSAQDWANRCRFDYGSVNLRRRRYKNFEQNIATIYPGDFLEQSVLFWHSENKNYDYSSGNCTTDKCERYTKIVRADNYLVGCGTGHCPILKDWKYLVCHYDGATTKAEKPYKSGASCSECPSEAPKCVSNLCDNTGSGDSMIRVSEDDSLTEHPGNVCDKIQCNNFFVALIMFAALML